MGAFVGGLTYRQYYVRDPLPQGWRDKFQARLAERAFAGIDPASEEERAVGWCSAAFPLDVELFPDAYLHNDYLVLGFRIDTLGVPGPILKLYTELEARRVMVEQKREHLNRYERAEIKERVKQDLRKRVLPSIKSIDLVWHLDEGTLRFWSTNDKVNQEFLELFEDTFEMTPIADVPYTAALHGDLGLDEEQVKRLVDLEPSFFIAGDLAQESIEALGAAAGGRGL